MATAVTVAGGVNTGTINLNAGTVDLSLERNDGTIVIAAGVTVTRILLGAASSVKTVSGPGAS